MKERSIIKRPIIMRTEEVRAILDGRKTQFRRAAEDVYFVGGRGEEDDPSSWGFEDQYGDYHTLRHEEPKMQIPCPFGQPGDLLWVQETWNDDWCDRVIYRADGGSAKEVGYPSEPKWCSPIYMPEKLCRLWLRVTGVRVERLQDISEVDAEREAPGEEIGIGIWTHPEHGDTRDPVFAFQWGWDSSHRPGKRWADNLWVRVGEFERTEVPT